MNIFKVVFHKNVPVGSWHKRPEQFYRDVELPFVPFVGLRLSGPWGHTDASVEVQYDTVKNVFWCHTAPDESLLDSEQEKRRPEDRLTLQQKIEQMEDNGWLHFKRETPPVFWFGGKQGRHES